MQMLWVTLWGLLWGVYFMLDGFKFGVGMTFFYVCKTEAEKLNLLNLLSGSGGGNAIWLVSATCATIAAFPLSFNFLLYYFFTPVFFIFFVLILRNILIFFRVRNIKHRIKKIFDYLIVICSALPSFLFGVAFGNILQGILSEKTLHLGFFPSILNPFGFLSGFVLLSFCLVHGSLWTAFKTEGTTSSRAFHLLPYLFPLLAFSITLLIVVTYLSTSLFQIFYNTPLLLLFPLLCIISILSSYFMRLKSLLISFLVSGFSIIFFIFTGLTNFYSIMTNQQMIFSLKEANSLLNVFAVAILGLVLIVISFHLWTFIVFNKSKFELSNKLKRQDAKII